MQKPYCLSQMTEQTLLILELSVMEKKISCGVNGMLQLENHNADPWGPAARPCHLQRRAIHHLKNSSWHATGPDRDGASDK